MKITTMSGKEIDTDKLSDKEAEIAEALENFKNICQRYNVSHVTFVAMGSEQGVMSQTVSKNAEVAREEIKFILESMNVYVSKATDGKWGIQKFQ